MDKKTIAVLFGGCSSEYDVSLSSAASVIENLNTEKYDLVLIGITREGTWLRYRGNIEDIRNDYWHTHLGCTPSFFSPSREVKGLIELVHTEYHVTPIDVVFPVLHGKYGEDGTLQGLLELSGIPFVGCDMLSSALCMDKELAHKLVKAEGIDTARSLTVDKRERMEEVLSAAQLLGFPLFVKPARSGSSLGITKVHNMKELASGIEHAFTHDNKVVIEQNIDGFEVGCAVLGNSDPMIGVVDEIELNGHFFDYSEKYSLKSSKIHLPARIDEDTASKVKETALSIYKILGCKGFARVDMFLATDGRIVFNEVNTIPGFTSSSRYPNMLQASGMTYANILDKLLELADAED
ncbi:D-alanine---D-serine ligase [Paenibacillus sophorae]|uniref:D-alanine--D-alanine ligase n=1 Tax=Paenibacillus sophorae TaxID=1333845 RepID=A0A1H8V925_9BACL|nr:D-alanine--D-serine ligase VanG [Paenibacillus sophorae]QWU13236.1 D-alanine--D-serine ligase VanG [Paenibacillus sophorae]SEP11952.1 D-alanine---D-serine ligase [Paenibacillus sophorae]